MIKDLLLSFGIAFIALLIGIVFMEISKKILEKKRQLFMRDRLVVIMDNYKNKGNKND